MPIQAKTFQTQLDQYIWLSVEVKDLIEHEKVQPSEIAIISRKHKSLVDLVPVLENMAIPISYDRGQDVLEKSEIAQLITILRFIDSLNESNQSSKEELLPEILCFKFWHLEAKDIYRLSQQAFQNRSSWLESMLAMENQDLKNIAEFLIALGKVAKNNALEQIIDEITGVSKQVYIADTTDEESNFSFSTAPIEYKYNPNQGSVNIIQHLDPEREPLTKFISGYKWYYFDREFEDHKPGNYLGFLSALKVFIEAVRNYKSGEILKLKDVIEYVDLLQARKIRLVDNSPYNSSSDAISLLTAHKSKGLEFEYVFVVDCIEEIWNGRKNVNKVGLPSNLPLLPQSENLNDSLRLFFVALTRAKTYLNLSSYKYGKDSKEVESLGCLVDLIEFQEVLSDLDFDKDKVKDLVKDLDTQQNSKFSPLTIWFESALLENDPKFDLKDYLKPQLENYKLSVTHLNNFLDLVRGGPKHFLEQNLLRFPQAKSPNAGYGTAMHAAINEFYKEFRRQNKLPSLDFLLEKYKICLFDQRLLAKDHDLFLGKGLSNLKLYYQDQHPNFSLNDHTEEDFKNQGVVLGANIENVEKVAKITGKIDKMVFSDTVKEIEVVDFKTGKLHTKWTDSSLDTAIKLQNYRRQLVFYKLLVENSRDFTNYKVNQGSLEFLDVPYNESKITILSTQISDQEAHDLARLISIVYTKITNLAKGESLPDVSYYSQDLQGIEDFIQDLLDQKI